MHVFRFHSLLMLKDNRPVLFETFVIILRLLRFLSFVRIIPGRFNIYLSFSVTDRKFQSVMYVTFVNFVHCSIFSFTNILTVL